MSTLAKDEHFRLDSLGERQSLPGGHDTKDNSA